MTSFQIHEDIENFRNIGIKKNACSAFNVSNNNKLGPQRKVLEKRTVLGHLTNLPAKKYDQISKSSPFKQPLIEVNKQSFLIKNDANKKKNGIKNTLDNACYYIPKYTYTEDSIISLDTPETVNQSIEGMSIDYSVIKSTHKVLEHYDSRLDYYTKELYRKDIHCYLLEAENKHRPQPLYMDKQPELCDSMRCILVDWLVSISDEYTFAPETLYLAVSYIDRFLSKMSVVRAKLQLVGVAAMMIASKYEEVYPPDTAEFAFLTNDTYSIKQILKMENLMLRVLSFDLTSPTTQTFIDEFAAQTSISQETIHMSMYVSELCLVESVRYTKYLPSLIAASCLAVSRYTLNEDIWPLELEDMSGYTLTELFPLIKQLHNLYKEAADKNLQAVRIKYSRGSLGSVSDIPPKMWYDEC